MQNAISLTPGMRKNLLSLRETTNLIDLTSKRLSTGKKVNSALDDPINYFAAEGHRQRATDLLSRKDEMSEAVQTIKAGDTGIESITDLVASAKSLASSALSADTTTEINDLESQFNEVLKQIDFLSADSGYKGINLLDSDTLEVSFDESGDSSVTLTGFDGTASGLGLSTISTNDWTTDSNITDSISELDSARTTLRSESKKLANNLSTITIRQDFTENLVNTLEEGADNLTLADMNEESANLLMLQTRQALSTSALAMSSQSAQSILRLF
jgi:flagellin-like hook-associated protein FlgL